MNYRESKPVPTSAFRSSMRVVAAVVLSLAVLAIFLGDPGEVDSRSRDRFLRCSALARRFEKIGEHAAVRYVRDACRGGERFGKWIAGGGTL